ncbi:CHASE2 domain-containing protein [Kamptonema animale CS-326]|jgi:CHASE2 domain-containing sensor protein/serine phosphatase RsbU (regulator of sigma subunit)|uniref:CHASE2 domain-containing protein n=1 Tax=Kamptonema animale TaxID=92934 RepID=UPI00232F0CFA|nr:CHASE2 domain-containing protein [Kamptonema animale]MDB9513697.1 CHASE2 domain-containing protein [Kamptonema animale CS-326]
MKNAVKLQQFISSWRIVLLVAPSLATLIIVLRFLGLFQMLEWAALDQWFRLRPPELPDSRIVIVTIDEASIRSIGQWPIPDAILAKVINKIHQQQPRAIGMDLYRDLPVQPGHEELMEALKSTPNLIGVQKLVGDGYGPEVNPPQGLNKLDRIAAADLVLDADGKVRRGLISLESQSGETVLGLGVKLALKYLEREGIELQELDANKRYYQLGKAKFIPFAKNDGGYIRADDRGYQIMLNYRGSQKNFKTFSMMQVLKGQMPANWGRDRLVLIGITAASINDNFFTPYSSSFTAFPERMPGVIIHANLTSQILSAALDGRSQIQVWSEPLQSLWIIKWCFLGAILTWGVQSQKLFNRRIARKKKIAILGLAASLLVVSSYLSFLLGWWIPFVAPLMALGGSTSAVAIYITYLIRQANTELANYSQEINLLNDCLKAENLRMVAELKVTRRLQQMILPKKSELLQIDGLEIAGFMEPADQIGGDYYDVLKCGDRIKIAIGDVTGHGLESGVLMLMVQTAVRTLLEAKFIEAKEFFSLLNRTIYKNLERMNSDKNMTLVLLDYNDRVLTLSGQHEEVIVVRSSHEVERIDTVELGFPIGLLEDIADTVASTEVKLNTGDVVVLYTDGITEALNINKMEYGLERLIEVVKQNYEASTAEIRDAVISDVRQHIGEQRVYDDITILILKQK